MKDVKISNSKQLKIDRLPNTALKSHAWAQPHHTDNNMGCEGNITVCECEGNMRKGKCKVELQKNLPFLHGPVYSHINGQ